MSTEKINMLKSFGAEVVITPTDFPATHPDHYVETAKRIAKEIPNAFYVNQYHSQENIRAHYHSTAPEIWSKLKENLTYLLRQLVRVGPFLGWVDILKKKRNTLKSSV